MIYTIIVIICIGMYRKWGMICWAKFLRILPNKVFHGKLSRCTLCLKHLNNTITRSLDIFTENLENRESLTQQIFPCLHYELLVTFTACITGIACCFTNIQIIRSSLRHKEGTSHFKSHFCFVACVTIKYL